MSVEEVVVPFKRKLLTVDFELGQKVYADNGCLEVTVLAVMKSLNTGEQYQVVWWYHGSRHIHWVCKDELSHARIAEAKK